MNRELGSLVEPAAERASVARLSVARKALVKSPVNVIVINIISNILLPGTSG